MATKKQVRTIFRKQADQLRKDLIADIRTLFHKAAENDEVTFDDEFEIEGRDDVVTGLFSTDDKDTDGFTTTISVATKYDGEEDSMLLMELGIDDLLNIHDELTDLISL